MTKPKTRTPKTPRTFRLTGSYTPIACPRCYKPLPLTGACQSHGCQLHPA